MNFNTTTGKAVKTLAWVIVSGAVTALIAFFTNHPDFFNPVFVGVINIVLVAIKNLADKDIKNI